MMQRFIAIFAAAPLSLANAYSVRVGVYGEEDEYRNYKYTLRFNFDAASAADTFRSHRHFDSDELTFSKLQAIVKEHNLPKLKSGLIFTTRSWANEKDLTDVIQTWCDKLGHDHVRILARHTGNPKADRYFTEALASVDEALLSGVMSLWNDKAEHEMLIQDLVGDIAKKWWQNTQDRKLPAGWVEYKAEDGKHAGESYYFNPETRETTWDRPARVPAVAGGVRP